MIRLFSSFDLGIRMFPLIGFLLINIILFNLFFIRNYKIFLMRYLYKFLISFFSSLKLNSTNKFIFVLFTGLFSLILYLNFLSIFPYRFPLTSQLSMILFFSLTMWVSLIIFSIVNSFKGFIMHCVPEGTPLLLVWLLFIIELVSNFIRPLTVTVRLTANILAGHLLIILLSKLVLFNISFLAIYAMLNIVEFFVSLIQAYIFRTIFILYYREVN